jgi:hypothetical protein
MRAHIDDIATLKRGSNIRIVAQIFLLLALEGIVSPLLKPLPKEMIKRTSDSTSRDCVTHIRIALDILVLVKLS